MTSIKLAIAAVALVGLSACDSNSSIGGLGKDKGAPNGGVDAGISQSSLNPASIEYFNQEIGDTVLFLVDQSTLTPEATALL